MRSATKEERRAVQNYIDSISVEPGPNFWKLINTKTLKEALHHSIRCGTCTNPMRSERGCDGGCQFDMELLKEIDSIIERYVDNLPDSPVYEVRPVLFGKWIEDGYYDSSFRVCSHCGYEHPNQKGMWKFCPNCGCDMRGGAECNY